MISKDKIEKFLGFTLAEVLITMIVIALMTLASVPVIKKSKEYRAAAKDKNTWMAFYDQNDQLHVYKDGTEDSSLIGHEGGEEYAIFEPPEGVTRFNVTVVGGGGGGAAGEAGEGQVKNFFYTDQFEQTFVPASDGIYQIIAIGGGGGGGGGAGLCEGYGGRSGGLVVQRANLKKTKAYKIQVGFSGNGGARKKFGETFGQILKPIGWAAFAAVSVLTGGLTIAGFAVTLTTLGAGILYGGFTAAMVGDLLESGKSNDRKDGGGNGAGSYFYGDDIVVTAGGGGGGEHRRKAGFWPKCRTAGGCGKENANNNCSNTTPFAGPKTKFGTDLYETQANGDAKYGDSVVYQGITDHSGQTGGKICDFGSNISCKDLNTMAGGMELSSFGKGGEGGGKRHSGKDGSAGMVQVKELPVFGGGAGTPGSISFYSYTKSPLAEGEEFVKVYPGKGGKGGQESGAEGEDGMFSRFGNRIIADGGAGGRARATNPAENEKNDLQAVGKDGIVGPMTKDLLDKVQYPSGSNLITEILGGLNYDGSCGSNGNFDGKGVGSCTNSDITSPGSSGAGGGAQGSKDFTGTPKWGKGGKGASGIVIVTW